MVPVTYAVPRRAVVPTERHDHQVGLEAKAFGHEKAPTLKKRISRDSRIDAFDLGLGILHPKSYFCLVDESFVMQQTCSKRARIAQKKESNFAVGLG
jgi:hypothetical protein